MTSVIKMLRSTFHPAVGSVRKGEVVEVPKELGDHWTNNNLAEDATGQEVTRTTASEAPTGQGGPNEFGQWPEPAALEQHRRDEPEREHHQDGNFSAMTSRSDVGLAPAQPTAPDGAPTVAEPTSGPMEPAAVPNADVPTAPDGSPTVAEPTSGPMHGADEAAEPEQAPA